MIIVSDRENVRIDVFLKDKTLFSRSKLAKIIKDGEVLINDKEVSASYKVKIGDVISYTEPSVEPLDLKPEKMELDIVYEDEYLAIINKPSGLVVHPAVGNYNHTLVNGLLYHFNNITDDSNISRILEMSTLISKTEYETGNNRSNPYAGA